MLGVSVLRQVHARDRTSAMLYGASADLRQERESTRGPGSLKSGGVVVVVAEDGVLGALDGASEGDERSVDLAGGAG